MNGHREAIEAFLSGYSSRVRPLKRLMVAQAYADDSVSDGAGKLFWLAGYIGHANHWLIFSDAWDAALREKPKLDGLHMTTPFDGWKREARTKKLLRLAEVIAVLKPMDISVHMSLDDFNEVYKPRTGYDFRHPYFMLFFMLVGMMAKLSGERARKAVPIDFIFDEQGNVGANALLVYEMLRSVNAFDPRWKDVLRNSPVFRSDDDVLPLQAADMLAWHLRRSKEERCSDEDRAILRMITPRTLFRATITRKALDDMGASFDQISDIEWRRKPASSLKKKFGKMIGSQRRRS